MDKIRNKKLELKFKVENLQIAEKQWISSQIKVSMGHLPTTEGMQMAIKIRKKATMEIFRLYQGGVSNAEYIAQHMDARSDITYLTVSHVTPTWSQGQTLHI